MILSISNKEKFIELVTQFFNLDEKGANWLYDRSKEFLKRCGFNELTDLYIERNDDNFIIRRVKDVKLRFGCAASNCMPTKKE